MTTYTVQSGDTLSKIAKATGMSVTEIAKQNGIKNVDQIAVGQKLSIGEVSQSNPASQEQPMVGMDTFQKGNQEPSSAQTYAPLAYGLAGAALYQGGKKALPKLKDMSETLQLKYMYGKDALKSGAQKTAETAKNNAKAVRNFVAQKAKHTAKSAELHYAFGKDAVKKGIENGKKAVQKEFNKTKKSINKNVKQAKKYVKKEVKFVKQSNSRAGRLLDGKTVRIKGNSVKLTKAGKLLGKGAVPIAVVTSAVEITNAYNKGGEKAAVKQGAKCAAGLAGSWAGAKAGAAIGTMICPGVGTAIGGFVGGIAGYLLGEKLFS